MLFDEINVDIITKDNELYVNVAQLANHLSKSISEFAHESSQLAKIFPLDVRERAFVVGLIEGMQSVTVMLKQADDEHTISNIHTIDEFLERLKDEPI